jgi:hypothetical protein
MRNYPEVIVLEEETRAQSSQSRELLKTNTPLLVWLIFLAVGGGLLTLYYARIGYIPDIEWSASIVYLAVASAVGGGVGLLLALSLLLPGLIWSESLVLDRKLSKAFCYQENSGELCLRSIFYRLGLPFGVVLFVSHLALRLGVVGYSMAAMVLLVITFSFMRARFEALLKVENCRTLHEKERRTFKYSAWFTLSVLLSQISMLVMYLLSGRPSGSAFVILTIVCTSAVLISNHVVAVQYPHRRQSVAAALVAAALLLFAADQFSPLSLRVMGHFGFGGATEANLVLNEEGAGIVEKLSLPNKCVPTNRDKLCDVGLLSKLGKEYYFSLEGRTFTLPKSAVLSLSSKDRRTK